MRVGDVGVAAVDAYDEDHVLVVVRAPFLDTPSPCPALCPCCLVPIPYLSVPSPFSPSLEWSFLSHRPTPSHTVPQQGLTSCHSPSRWVWHLRPWAGAKPTVSLHALSADLHFPQSTNDEVSFQIQVHRVLFPPQARTVMSDAGSGDVAEEAAHDHVAEREAVVAAVAVGRAPDAVDACEHSSNPVGPQRVLVHACSERASLVLLLPVLSQRDVAGESSLYDDVTVGVAVGRATVVDDDVRYRRKIQECLYPG